jgi:hypothetical protein
MGTKHDEEVAAINKQHQVAAESPPKSAPVDMVQVYGFSKERICDELRKAKRFRSIGVVNELNCCGDDDDVLFVAAHSEEEAKKLLIKGEAGVCSTCLATALEAGKWQINAINEKGEHF